MEIKDLLKTEVMILDLQATSKEAVIDEMVAFAFDRRSSLMRQIANQRRHAVPLTGWNDESAAIEHSVMLEQHIGRLDLHHVRFPIAADYGARVNEGFSPEDQTILRTELNRLVEYISAQMLRQASGVALSCRKNE